MTDLTDLEKENRRLRHERNKLQDDLYHAQQRRVKLPNIQPFRGDGKDRVQDFIFQIKQSIAFNRVDQEDDKLNFLVGHLAKNSLTYYLTLKSINEEEVNTFDGLLEKLKNKFTPLNETTLLRSKLYEAKQLRGVEEYITWFNQCLLKVPTMDGETQKELFIKGLKLELKRLVTLAEPEDLLAAQTKALNLSNLNKGVSNNNHKSNTVELNTVDNKRKKWKNNKKRGKGKNAQPVDSTQQTTNNTNSNKPCYICKVPGHIADECKSRCPNDRCQKFANHKASDCRFKQAGDNTRANQQRNEYGRLTTIYEDIDDEKFTLPYDDDEIVIQDSIHSSVNRINNSSLLMCVARINNTKLQVLFDTGASTSFINNKKFQQLGLQLNESKKPVVRMANNQETTCEGITTADLFFDEPSKFSVEVELRVLNLNFDIILGMDFLYKYRSELRLADKLIHLYSTHDITQIFTIKLIPWKQTGVDEVVDQIMIIVDNIKDSQEHSGHLGKLLDQYKDIFEPITKVNPNGKIEHRIELSDPNPTLPKTPIYRLNPTQLKELKTQLDKMLQAGFIKDSQSRYASPCLFVRKKDNSFRLVIDYRQINQYIVKNNYTIPLIDDLLIQLSSSYVFSKIDLLTGYYQIPMRVGDRPLTAFKSQLGLYEFVVMPMGIRNAVESFQHNMQHCLHKLINVCCVVYLDDILVYSANEEEHLIHLQQVLDALRSHNYKAKRSKCHFLLHEINFLGNIIGNGQVRPDENKIKAITMLARPETKKQLQAFIGSVGYYQRFIKDFSKIAVPLTALFKKDAEYIWTDECEQAYQQLKTSLTSNSVLLLPDFSQPFYLFVDASSVSTGAVLTQFDKGVYRPIHYSSHKFSPTQLNKAIYEKEFISLIYALRQFKMYLQSSHFYVYTDCRALIYINKQRTISAMLSRQLQLISEFDFEIFHIKGTKNLTADMLSRVPVTSQYISNEKNHLEDEDENILSAIALPEQNNTITSSKPVVATIKPKRKLITKDEDKADILKAYHDSITAAHPGIAATYKAIQEHYTWYGLKGDVVKFVSHCHDCQLNKHTTTKPGGLLQPIISPCIRWHTVSLDFIMPLTKSEDYDAILVVVDKFSKFTIIIPTKSTVTAVGTAQLLIQHVISYFGIMKVIISDRDTRFTSGVIKELMNQLGITQQFSTSYHPQSDGQTEIVNKHIISTLRFYVNSTTSNWSNYLGIVQLSINSRVHSSTNMSPYYLNFGRIPNTFNINLTRQNMNEVEYEYVSKYLKNISAAVKHAEKSLAKAQAKQKFQADKHRRQLTFEIGEYCLLSTKNLRITNKNISKKLLSPYIGPFEIINKRDNVYQLDLSHTKLKIYNWFHVNLLKKYLYDPGQINIEDTKKQLRFYDSGEDRYEVDRILDYKNGKYLILWRGFPSSEASWVHHKDIDAPDKIREYKENH